MSDTLIAALKLVIGARVAKAIIVAVAAVAAVVVAVVVDGACCVHVSAYD